MAIFTASVNFNGPLFLARFISILHCSLSSPFLNRLTTGASHASSVESGEAISHKLLNAVYTQYYCVFVRCYVFSLSSIDEYFRPISCP